MIYPGDYIVDSENSPVEIDAVVEHIEHNPAGAYVHTTMGEKFPLAWCEKFCGPVEKIEIDLTRSGLHVYTGYKKQEPEKGKDTCETGENRKDSCAENIGITDLIEAALQYNGHAQLVLERIRLDQVRPLMRELEEVYCTKGGRGINAVICEDGSGALECENYWPDGNCLGHTSRTLIGWNGLEGW